MEKEEKPRVYFFEELRNGLLSIEKQEVKERVLAAADLTISGRNPNGRQSAVWEGCTVTFYVVHRGWIDLGRSIHCIKSGIWQDSGVHAGCRDSDCLVFRERHYARELEEVRRRMAHRAEMERAREASLVMKHLTDAKRGRCVCPDPTCIFNRIREELQKK